MASPLHSPAKTADAERHTHPTHRASRLTLRRLYHSLSAACRMDQRQSTDVMEAKADYTPLSREHRHIAGDVFASHPELVESPTPDGPNQASGSFHGLGFLRHKRHSSVAGSPSSQFSSQYLAECDLHYVPNLLTKWSS